MTETLDTLLNKLEPTDELILLNKHYQRLEAIDEKLEELVALMYNLDEPNLECMNGEIKMYAKKRKRLDVEDTIKRLELIQSAVSHEHTLTGMKSREIFTFQKLGKAISIYKSI